jgi:hypothetical protein
METGHKMDYESSCRKLDFNEQDQQNSSKWNAEAADEYNLQTEVDNGEATLILKSANIHTSIALRLLREYSY